MKGRKLYSMLLVVIMLVTMLPVGVLASEKDGIETFISLGETFQSQEGSDSDISVGKGYEVEFKVISKWDGKFDGEILIRNTGNQTIESWALKFDSKQQINNVWNAELISTEEGYIFKNLNWNKDIKPGASVSIGFGADWEEEIEIPESYELLTSKQSIDNKDYSIDFKITSDWGQAYNGEISITNHTEEVIEDWILEFDFDHSIDSFWTAKIHEDKNGHYIIKNDGYNANIGPGQTFKLGFEGSPGDVIDNALNFTLKEASHTSEEIDYEKDTDEDGLPDWLEEELGTDPLNPDTDGDGLPDGYEYLVLGTDPLKKDTDDNGINDGDEHFDGDGLTNLEEYELGTDPFNEDTDFDGLTDYDEVHIYGTDPLKYDTDEDGLSDGQEIELGTDPLNPDTDGNGILDGDEIYTIEKTPEPEFTDKNVIPTVRIDLAGRLMESLDIYALSEDNLYLPSEMPGYIGAGYEFELGGEFEEATLTFEFNPDFLEIEDFDPAIYYYDEEKQLMEYVEGQEIDWENNQVSTEISHFSKYILINNTKYLDVWEEVIKVPNEEDINKPLDIVLVIDSSGSMSWNDPKGMRKSTAKGFVDELREDYRVSIVDFDSRAYLLSSLTHDKEAAKKSIDRIDSSGGTSLTAGIQMALQQFTTSKSASADYSAYDNMILDFEEPGENGLDIDGNVLENPMIQMRTLSERDSLKYIIMLTDGRGAYNHNLTKTAIDNDVTIYTVGLGNDLDEPLLRKIASETGGRYLYAAKAEELVDEFLNLSEDVIDFSRDSDEDGLSDYYEKKLRYSNGLRIDTDPFKKDTDGDELLDSEEIIISEDKVTIRGKEYQRVYAKMKSHPKMKDTDGDGIPDNLDSDKLVYNITDRTLALAAGFSYENLRSKKGKYVGNAGEAELSNFQVIHANNSGFITFNDFFDKGLGSVAIKMSRENKNDAIIFAFRGTEVKEDLINDFSQDILLGLGLNSTQSNKAFKEYQSLVRKYPNADFFLAGHSLGGRLVQDVLYRAYDRNNGITSFLKDDIKTPVHSATFNALGYNKIQFFSNKLFKTKTINEIRSKLNNYYYKYDRVGEQLGNSMMFKRLGTDIGPYDAKDGDDYIPKPLIGKYYTTKVHGIKRFYDEEKLKDPKTNIY